MREYFWVEHYKDDKVESFTKTFKNHSGVIIVTAVDDDHCKIKFTQRDVDVVLELERDGVAKINGMCTGKKVWYTDIEFSMEFDEFGGLHLVLKDGDYMTVRMDGKVVSFMGIPFEKLNTYETAEVARVKAQYRKDWYNTLY